MPNHVAVHSPLRLRTQLQIARDGGRPLMAATFVAAPPVRAAGGDGLRAGGECVSR